MTEDEKRSRVHLKMVKRMSSVKMPMYYKEDYPNPDQLPCKEYLHKLSMYSERPPWSYYDNLFSRIDANTSNDESSAKVRVLMNEKKQRYQKMIFKNENKARQAKRAGKRQSMDDR